MAVTVVDTTSVRVLAERLNSVTIMVSSFRNSGRLGDNTRTLSGMNL